MKNAFLIISIAVLFFSCQSGKEERKNTVKDVVTVSILPQQTFVEKIAGDDFKVNVLIPPGSSPAAYTLLPSQLKDISRSEVWFRIGYIGFEHSWKDKIQQANKDMKVVDLSEGLDLIAGSIEQHGDHVHVDGVDPHIWLSPSMVQKMAGRIKEVLVEMKPERREAYESNYQQFLEEIDQLDKKIRDTLSNYAGREFITFHPSLSYYAREYGLVQHSLESGGKEPSPQHMAKVVKLARESDIDVIYIQSEFDRDHARVFAEEIDGQIEEVKPLNPDWATNLEKMTHILIKHFK